MPEDFVVIQVELVGYRIFRPFENGVEAVAAE